MECVEGAFKPNFMGIKFNHLPPSFSDDFWAVNGASGDDFFVDELLDFSTDAGFVEEDDNSQVLRHTDDTNFNKPSSVTPVKTENHQKAIIPESELSLPVNDVTELEWVSQFVDDDSFSGDCSLISPARKFPETETETVTLVAVNPSFKNSVHKRARSKRSRTGGRVWSLRSTSTLPDSSTSCSYASNPLLTAEEISRKQPVQRQRKKRSAEMAGTVGSGQRRCSHCLVQKTPQWRAGPLGAKTLCNACGVRFKSGRLLPEYRPACSPTFSYEVHSNNHRKVLEMRRKKEEEAGGCQPV